MTRLLTCGYETGDLNEAGVATLGSGVFSVVSSTPTPRAGAYCLKLAASGSTMTASYKTFTLPSAKTDLWVRFAVYMHPASSASETVIAGVQDGSGGASSCVTWDPAGGIVRARQQNSGSGILLGTSGTALPPDTWHVIDWRTQITSATAGTTEVWLDGNQAITFSGDNTGPSAGTTVQIVLLGSLTGTLLSSTGLYLAFDDIAINDTAGTRNNGRAGDGRVVLLSPTGNSGTPQFVRGGTDTGANWSQVSEIPPSLTQYVGSPTVGNRDLYTLADLPVAVQSINVVEVIALAQNSDAGGGSLAPTVDSSGTVNEATAVGLSTSAGYITGRWETNPNGGAAWTAAAVNALAAGMTVR